MLYVRMYVRTQLTAWPLLVPVSCMWLPDHAVSVGMELGDDCVKASSCVLLYCAHISFLLVSFTLQC